MVSLGEGAGAACPRSYYSLCHVNLYVLLLGLVSLGVLTDGGTVDFFASKSDDLI